MLNFAFKGTYQDPTGYNWDFYSDDHLDPNPDPNAFYIIPKPTLVMDSVGNPSFQILNYTTDGSNNGSGYLRFDVELTVPQSIMAGVTAAILADPVKFPNVTTPVFLTLALNEASTASFNIDAAGVTTTYTANASGFGGNVASFLLNLTKIQLDTVSAAFNQTGGAIAITYYLSVPARLQGVSAVLTFDSSIAYQYQVTQATYNEWGDQSNPASVTTLLNESASSNVIITWGMANPPAELVTSVTNWANQTLAGLVTAEVQKVIELQGLQSDNSFNINEVSSFTANFSENMVIDWLIQPTATIPSFPDMKLQLSNFTVNVNEQQQQMLVSTNLPFAGDSTVSPNMVPEVSTTGGVKQAYVKSVVVTVHYPTLTEADSSYTFTSNARKAFIADYDLTNGPEWSLQYQVNYVDPNMPTVSGTISSITSANYILKMEEAGILTVVFDATQAFSGEGTLPTEVDINFSYINGMEPESNKIQQKLKILAKDTSFLATISSLQAMPISTTYNYSVNYIFPGGIVYSAPLVQNQNGFLQIINAANVVHPVNIMVYVSPADATANPVFDATVNMWYAQPLTIPPGFSSNQPTKQAPAAFNITLNTLSTGGLMGKASFDGLLSGDQPLMYSASMDTANGPININAQQIENTQASIMVSPTQEYFTLEVSPASINWQSAKYLSVVVLITMTVAQGTAPTVAGIGIKQQQSLTWNTGEEGANYITIPIQTGNVVSYATEVRYVTPGSADVVKNTVNQSDVVFEIPAIPGALSITVNQTEEVLENSVKS